MKKADKKSIKSQLSKMFLLISATPPLLGGLKISIRIFNSEADSTYKVNKDG